MSSIKKKLFDGVSAVACVNMYCIQGVQLPADGTVRNITGEDTEADAGTISSFECIGTEAKIMKPSSSAVNKKQISNSRYGLLIRSL